MVNNGSSGAQFDGCHGWHGTSKNSSYVKKQIAWSHRENFHAFGSGHTERMGPCRCKWMTSARVRVPLHRLLKTLKIGVNANFRLQYSALKNSATLHDYFIHEQKKLVLSKGQGKFNPFRSRTGRTEGWQISVHLRANS